MKSSRTLLALPILLALLSGCASFSRFGTARTMPAGESRWALTLDAGWGALSEERARDGIWVPTPHVRWERGLAEGTELGIETGIPGMLGVDVKRELVRTRHFDLAVAPGVSATFSSGGFVAGQVPLVADLVVLPWLVVVPHAGAGWGLRADSAHGTLHGPLAGGGVGLYVRASDWFAIQPAWSSTWELDTLYVHRRVGLAFSFGAQPEF